MKELQPVLLLIVSLGVVAQAKATNSVARVWDERALAAIRQDTPHPPAQARNYFSLSVCMYDAWTAYDPVAVGTSIAANTPRPTSRRPGTKRSAMRLGES